MIKMGHNLSDFNITNATILTTSQARLQFWLLGQIAIHIVKNTFQVFYILLAIPKFITTIFFSIFDTKCVVFEHASVINCSQKFFTSNPGHWVVAWLGLSFTSSFTFLLIVWCNRHELNYQLDKAKKIWKKGSFWSLMFLLLPTVGFNAFRIATRKEEINKMLTVLLLLWEPVTLLVVCCLNYLPRVRWQETSDRSVCSPMWWKACLSKNSNLFIYWLALVLYFVEILINFASILFDAEHEVIPLMQHGFPKVSNQYSELMFIWVGFILAFHARLLSFIWEKFFHGEKDLISEPNARLVDDSLAQDQQHAQQDRREESVPMENVSCEK